MPAIKIENITWSDHSENIKLPVEAIIEITPEGFDVIKKSGLVNIENYLREE